MLFILLQRAPELYERPLGYLGELIFKCFGASQVARLVGQIHGVEEILGPLALNFRNFNKDNDPFCRTCNFLSHSFNLKEFRQNLECQVTPIWQKLPIEKSQPQNSVMKRVYNLVAWY